MVETSEAIPAYGISLKLELVDMVREGAHGNGSHVFKHRAYEKYIMVHSFASENNMCPLGQSSYSFQMDVPADLVQSMYWTEPGFRVFRTKLNYFLKAQIVPVNHDLINNAWGKC